MLPNCQGTVLPYADECQSEGFVGSKVSAVALALFSVHLFFLFLHAIFTLWANTKFCLFGMMRRTDGMPKMTIFP
jgi:hypothetical protein